MATIRWYYRRAKKERGLRLLTFFDLEESAVVPEHGICVCYLASKIEPLVTTNLKCLNLFLHRIQLNISCMFIKRFNFLKTVQVELISLQHCSSRNRKILHHIVHILRFLAWLSGVIKHITHKLVAQADLQKLRSHHDLSKVICVDVTNKRIQRCLNVLI